MGIELPGQIFLLLMLRGFRAQGSKLLALESELLYCLFCLHLTPSKSQKQCVLDDRLLLPWPGVQLRHWAGGMVSDGSFLYKKKNQIVSWWHRTAFRKSLGHKIDLLYFREWVLLPSPSWFSSCSPSILSAEVMGTPYLSGLEFLLKGHFWPDYLVCVSEPGTLSNLTAIHSGQESPWAPPIMKPYLLSWAMCREFFLITKHALPFQ